MNKSEKAQITLGKNPACAVQSPCDIKITHEPRGFFRGRTDMQVCFPKSAPEFIRLETTHVFNAEAAIDRWLGLLDAMSIDARNGALNFALDGEILHTQPGTDKSAKTAFMGAVRDILLAQPVRAYVRPLPQAETTLQQR